jgi:hypothetical protein
VAARLTVEGMEGALGHASIQITVDTYGTSFRGPIAPPSTSWMTHRRNRMQTPRNRRRLRPITANDVSCLD